MKENQPSISSESGKFGTSSSRSRPPMSPRVVPQEERKKSMKQTLDTIEPPPPPPHIQSPKYARPMTKTSPNRPRAPSWLLEGDKENGKEDDSSKDQHKSKYMVEAIRAVLRKTEAIKPLTRYLRDHLDQIFINGKRAPEADDVRHIVVMAWVEELLRFLVIKVMSNDVLSPCNLASTPPIDIAWMGVTQMPSIYSKICRKLGVQSGIIENDLTYAYEDDEGDSLSDKKERFSVTCRAYQHCFDQAPPDLYWPEPKEKIVVNENNMLALINTNVGHLNVSDFVAVPETIMNEIKDSVDPESLYKKTSKIFKNGCQYSQAQLQNGCRTDITDMEPHEKQEQIRKDLQKRMSV